ncbi:MAG: phosphatidylserine decarboxylase [Negativicutes bacterium]|jgi:phosphatidylserine decarboxylase
MRKEYFLREGIPFYLCFLVLAGLAYRYISLPLWIVPMGLAIYMAYFFRNPKRVIPQAANIIVSPAEGKVMGVEEIFESEYLDAPGKKVTIFLSPFNVHVNRAPIFGEIKFQEYVQGRFVPAYKVFAAWENERHTIGIENQEIKVLVSQIAGILARRIVSWVTIGAKLNKGDTYGMIKFGSCTEIVVPMNVDVMVKPGDKVRCGETVLGIIRRNDE